MGGRAIQSGIHALTGGSSADERALRAHDVLNWKPGSQSHGNALHAFGDSFAHSRLDDSTKMYPPPFGHAEHWHDPDRIEIRPKLYGAYVRQLFDILSTQAGLDAAQKSDRVKIVEEFIAKVSSASNEESQIAVINWYVSQFDLKDVNPWQPELHELEHFDLLKQKQDVPKPIQKSRLEISQQRAHEWKNPDRSVPVAPLK